MFPWNFSLMVWVLSYIVTFPTVLTILSHHIQFDLIDHQNLIALKIVKHPRNHVIHPTEAPASRTCAPARGTTRNNGNTIAAFNAGMALNGRKCRSHRLRGSHVPPIPFSRRFMHSKKEQNDKDILDTFREV